MEGSDHEVSIPIPSQIQTESLVFRYGRDMAPEAIAAETPGARFVARARLVDGAATGITGFTDDGPAVTATGDQAGTGTWPGTGTGTGADAVWGILLIQPEPPAGRRAADVMTDDGRVTHATILTGAAALADLGAVVTQARYWELAPSYIDGLDRRRTARR